MEMKIVAIVLACLLILVSLMFLFREFTSLHGKNKEIERRLTKLEQASRFRMPYRSQDEILDAMAALDALMHELQFRTDLIDIAKGHLTNSMAVGTNRMPNGNNNE